MLFLGIEVAQSQKGYLLSKPKYIPSLVKRPRLYYNRIVYTPLETNMHFSSNGFPLLYLSLYHTNVGSLIYIRVTSLDIDHVFHMVSQFVTTSNSVQWGVVLRILRYFHGT